MSNTHLVGALILAAGKGSRIGVPKWRLKLKGVRLLELLIERLSNAGITDICCIMEPNESLLFHAPHTTTKVVLNPKPERGMFSSIILGVNQLNNREYLLIQPVDHPFIQSETYEMMLEMIQSHPRHIIQPTFKGTGGHPIIVPTTLLHGHDPDDDTQTLHTLIKSSSLPIHRFETQDEGVLLNINTTEDLDKLKDISC